MPNARRITFGTQVIPTQSIEMEETSVRHAEFMASPGTTIGGKGIATINATQWGDGWTSFYHFGSAQWENQDENWELQGESWSGKLGISDTTTDLTDDSNDLAFLYIKNTGTTNEALVSLNGTSGNYYIIVPPEGSVHLRGDGTTLDCNDVFVKCSGGETTTIEFIIAKE